MMTRRQLLRRPRQRSARHALDQLQLDGPRALVLTRRHVALARGVLKRHRLIGAKLSKNLVANIDRVEIDVPPARFDESEAAVWSDALDRAIEHRASVIQIA